MIAAISASRPTNFVRPRPERCKRVRSDPSAVTSYMLTGSLTPLTFVGPIALSAKYPSQS